jgi:ElaB/YqjD/DUF883 family membrane-anchored ribosome-binding protein
MRTQVGATGNKQFSNAMLRSAEEIADTATAQASEATRNLTRNVREHPIAWAAGAVAVAAAVGLLVARGAKH